MVTKLLGCAVALGLAALTAIPAQAADFNFNSNFSKDNDVQLFKVTVGSGVGQVQTTSWATGGFDPILTQFDSAGNYSFNENNDIDTASGKFDAQLFLTPGSYLVALTQNDNYFNLSNPSLQLNLPTLVNGLGSVSNAGFDKDAKPTFTQGDPSDPIQNQICGNSGPFCGQTSAWAITFQGVDSATPVAPAVVPLPAPVGLFVAALGSLGFVARRRKAS